MLTEKDLETFYKNVGRIIKSARVGKNISQEELANYLGFKSRVSIVNIENGTQNIQLHTLVEIASFLNLPIIDLLPSNSSQEQISESVIQNVEKTMSNPVDAKSSEKVLDFVRLVLLKK